MKNLFRFVLTTVMALAGGAQAATYGVTSANYNTLINFTAPCGLGTCTNFTPAMNISGTFAVPTLAANLSNQNIVGTLTAFSFSDGINTYASTDSTVRAYRFEVTTDATGNLSGVEIFLERWLSGTSPHAVNDLFAFLQINTAGASYHNSQCALVGPSTFSAVADSCQVDGGGTQHSHANAPVGLTFTSPTPPPAPVPTLSQWAQIVMAGLMTLVGLWQARRFARR